MTYLLQPTTTKLFWKRTASFPSALGQKRVAGESLSQADIPNEVSVDGDFRLPDFCEKSYGHVFVSDEGRSAIEKVAPGCAVFFDISVQAPVEMHPRGRYYYMDVVSRAQTIDWEKSETKLMHSPFFEEGEAQVLKGAITGPWAKFRNLTFSDPPLWRESDLHVGEVRFFQHKTDVLMRDDAWELLDQIFPGQLLPTKLSG